MADSDGQQQYLRTCTLLVYGADQKGLDLSQFRIKFAVKRSNSSSPNSADIYVYNLSSETAQEIRAAFSPGIADATSGLTYYPGHVLLQGGYESNFGTIFQGNIKQIIVGRESATDTFINIVAGDGDNAYSYAVVTKTLASGSSQEDQISASIEPMVKKGVTAGQVSTATSTQKLARGKVMYGTSQKYLRHSAKNTNHTWSIQDEKVNFIHQNGYLPGEAVILTSKTGMIGTPQQTNLGVSVKCLLNPLIHVGTRFKIDNASVARFKINLAAEGKAGDIPAPLTDDGVYFTLIVEHSGDTRAIEWYSTLTGIQQDSTTNPINSVPGDYGP